MTLVVPKIDVLGYASGVAMVFDWMIEIDNENQHSQFMREALALADAAALQGEVPVGAIVVHNGVIVGRGENRRETLQDPTAHAEIIALREAANTLGTWRLEDCTLYVTLEPCPMCAGALMLSRIGMCVYGCTDPKGGFLGTLADLSDFDGLNHSFEVVSGILGSSCSEKLTSFFRGLRAKQKAAKRAAASQTLGGDCTAVGRSKEPS